MPIIPFAGGVVYRFSMDTVHLVLLVAALYDLALVVIILWKTPSHRAGRNFAWYILWIAAWTLCVALMLPRFGEEIGTRLARGTFFAATMAVISWVWFCADFPRASRQFHATAWILTVQGLPWLVISWSPHVIGWIHYRPDGIHTEFGQAMTALFAIWVIASTLIGVGHMATKARTCSSLERLQVRYILLGSIALLIAGSIPNLILPALTGSTRFATLGPLSSLFVTTTATYAIVRYRLLDIKLVLRTGLIYSITITMLSALFALLVPALDLLLVGYLRFPSHTGSIIMAFLIMLAFQPVRHRVQHFIDQRLFFDRHADYRLSLRDACRALASARESDEVVANLLGALERSLQPQRMAVYLPGPERTFVRLTCTESWTTLPKCLSETDDVLVYAKATDEMVLTDEAVRRAAPHHAIGLRLMSWTVAGMVPLIAGHRMCGIVFLGEKGSGDVYSTDDMGLLRILGKQTALALDNARHYDEMAVMNEYHARLLHVMRDGVIALDPHQRIITFNEAAERITGVSATEAIGKGLAEVGIRHFPTHTTEGHAVEVVLDTREGGEIPVLVTVTPFLRRWEVNSSRLLVFHDLSAVRALEREKIQAERFSSMGAMAASLAQEIQRPLEPIRTLAHQLHARYDEEEFRTAFSHTVGNEVGRINHLIGQMLDLVRTSPTDRGMVDFREVIERLVLLIQPECERNGIDLQAVFPPDLPPVAGVASQLYQALLNVLMASMQLLPEGGELTITAEEYAGELRCLVTCEGTGSTAGRLPGLTAVPSDDLGIGIGLADQFIRAHDGRLQTEHAGSGGVTFSLMLPIRQPTA